MKIRGNDIHLNPFSRVARAQYNSLDKRDRRLAVLTAVFASVVFPLVIPTIIAFRAVVIHLSKQSSPSSESKPNELGTKILGIKDETGSVDDNDPQGLYDFAKKLEVGEGVEENFELAMEYYKKAADKKLPEAQYDYAALLLHGTHSKASNIDEKQAFHYFKLAYENGFKPAYLEVARCYEEGIGVEKDPKEAFMMYLSAADQGLPEAQFDAGRCYEEGIGVEKNPVEAFHMYRRAADSEFAPAEYRVGLSLEEGLGVQEDKKMAFEFYRRAALQGFSSAEYRLGLCYRYGIGVEKDPKQALEWFQKASQQGEREALYEQGLCLRKGIGTTVNFEEALVYFQKAAEYGHVNSLEMLSEMYQLGQGVSKDEEEAKKWLEKYQNLDSE